MTATPTERFAALAAGDEEAIPLDETALLIAAHAHPDLDLATQLARLDDLAATCPERSFEGLRQHLFVDQGFLGDVETYEDPENSFLDSVLDRRTGIPISLSVLAIEVGRRVDVPLVGIGMPGHFLVRNRDRPDQFLDPFHGGEALDQAGCEARFRAVHGPDAPFDEGMLAPVGTRAILSRMLANLRGAYARGDRLAPLQWVLELRLALPETPALERRELASVLSALGRYGDAAHQLELLAEVTPEHQTTLEREAVALRARLN